MLRLSFLFLLLASLTGCSTYKMFRDYNQELADYPGENRVAIAFKTRMQTRIYPETGTCIDLRSLKNGFLGPTQDKGINYPEISDLHRGINSIHWVSSNQNIAIRIIYTGMKVGSNVFNSGARVSESFIVFKPEPGDYYYVTDDGMEFQDSTTGKYLKIYKVVDDKGSKKLEPVKQLNINNCPGQKPWYQAMGAII